MDHSIKERRNSDHLQAEEQKKGKKKQKKNIPSSFLPDYIPHSIRRGNEGVSIYSFSPSLIYPIPLLYSLVHPLRLMLKNICTLSLFYTPACSLTFPLLYDSSSLLLPLSQTSNLLTQKQWTITSAFLSKCVF